MRVARRNSRALAPLLAGIWLLAGCTVAVEIGPEEDRGQLVSVGGPQWYAKVTIQLLLQGLEVDLQPDYDVNVYKLVYETVDADGAKTQASGAMAVPVGVEAPPLVSYQHGTVVLRTDVPSAGSEEATIGLALASVGHVVAMPDYLGLGESPGLHPYVHAKTEATAVVDMLRATRLAMAQLTRSLGEDVVLLGYSQGGHATMAAAREIETQHPLEFQLVSSSPMAGPYDMSETMLELMLDDQLEHPSPYYLPYVMLAYNAVYKLHETDAEMFREPYDTLLPALFDGEHTADEINEVMPKVAVQCMNPTLVEAVQADPQHPWRVVLRENDVRGDNEDYLWFPEVPIDLYHCPNDAHVPFANAQVAEVKLRQKKADVELVVPEGGELADHADCVLPSLTEAMQRLGVALGP